MLQEFINSITGVLNYPDISPYIISWGWLKIRWYSVIYIGGFVITFFFLRHFSKSGRLKLDIKLVDDFVLWLFIGVVGGARLFYIIFYNPQAYIEEPLRILTIWRGGLSFHGGLFGVLLVAFIFSKRHKLNYFSSLDALSLVAPIALGLGRVGNFLNGELWGRPAPEWLPWAMIFPKGGEIARHPSQIYEAITEGLLPAILLWALFYKLKLRPGLISALFLISYGAGRFFAEFFRQPDEQLGLLFLSLSMGQIMCLVMIFLGAVWAWALYGSRIGELFDYSVKN